MKLEARFERVVLLETKEGRLPADSEVIVGRVGEPTDTGREKHSATSIRQSAKTTVRKRTAPQGGSVKMSFFLIDSGLSMRYLEAALKGGSTP